MIDLALNFSHDIYKNDGGDLELVSERDAIDQNLDQELQFWAGEWFLDTSHGVPYRQIVFVKNPNLDLIQATILNTILDADGITEVDDFSFAYDAKNRGLSIQFVAQSTKGEIVSNTQVKVGV